MIPTSEPTTPTSENISTNNYIVVIQFIGLSKPTFNMDKMVSDLAKLRWVIHNKLNEQYLRRHHRDQHEFYVLIAEITEALMEYTSTLYTEENIRQIIQSENVFHKIAPCGLCIEVDFKFYMNTIGEEYESESELESQEDYEEDEYDSADNYSIDSDTINPRYYIDGSDFDD